MDVYLLTHVTFPTEIDGDAVEFINPIAVYVDKRMADEEAEVLNATPSPLVDESFDVNYAEPYYQVISVPYKGLRDE